MKSTLCGWVLACAAVVPAAYADGFVTRDGAKLMLDGREYRAVGVNVPHLSQAYNGTWHHWREIYGTREAMRQSAVEAILDAERHKIAFIRFFASPGYPKGMAELYGKDREAYWGQMDELFALCREHRVKLVPSLGILTWHSATGERMTAVADPESRTGRAARDYVREFVTRYRDDPTVLMWELENEAFLKADVNQEGRKALPLGVFPEGTEEVRETYTLEDSWRFDTLQALYRDMTAFIKAIDPNHAVTGGDAGPREESMCRRLTFPDFKWRNDTLREHLANLLDSQPEPLDVVSIHVYGDFNGTSKVENLPYLDFLRARVRAVHAARSPVFVGELGQIDPPHRADPATAWTRAAIDVLDEEGASLTAVWVWYFPWQKADHDIPDGEFAPQLMERIRTFNERHAGL